MIEHNVKCDFYGSRCRCDETTSDTMPAPPPHLTIQALVEDSHNRAVRKGFHEAGVPPVPELLALLHSEVSEALESYRDGHMVTTYRSDGKPEGFASELADVAIRLAHMCGALGIDLEREIEIKAAYNETRPHKHGKKC